MDKLMGQKEVKRSQILGRLKEGKISQQEAAQQMDIGGTRQARRLVRRAGRFGRVDQQETRQRFASKAR